MYQFYEVSQLGEGLYKIAERHFPKGMAVMMYLIVGEKEAALIDSGFGVTDTLRTCVEKLTDKPITCYVAHGHPDHAGAAALFDRVYMSERDDALLGISLSKERRVDDVFRMGQDDAMRAYIDAHIVMTDKLNYRNIDAGDVIDLGGKQLEVYALPGHTQGSLAFYDRAGNYAMTSDAFSPRTALTTLPKEKRVGLTAYRDGLDRFLNAINEDTVLLTGHGEEPMSQQIPRDMLQACCEVLDGKTENDVVCDNIFSRRLSAAGKKMCEHKTGCVTLVYDANTL